MSETYSHHINMHQGIWIDIFPLDHISNDAKKCAHLKRKVLFYKNLYIIRCGYKNPHTDSFAYRVAYAICKVIVKPFSIQFFVNKLDKNMRCMENEKTEYLFPYGGAYPNKDTTPAKLLDELSEYEFEGHKFMSLKNYDSYLKQLYGDYMELPPVENRVGGMHNLYKVAVKDGKEE